MQGNGSNTSPAYYPIRVVSTETGINAITLRAWERRYGLITPKRTEKGHRLYTEDDIHLIRKVVSLMNRGIPISQAQAMVKNGDTLIESPAQTSVTSGPSQWQHYREQLQIAVSEFDDKMVKRIFEEVNQFFPIDICIRFLFIPFQRQLIQDQSLELGPARLAFFNGLLESRLAWRLTDGDSDTDQRVLMANCSVADQVDILFLGITLQHLGIGVTRLTGLTAFRQIATLIKAQPKWNALILQLGASPEPHIIKDIHKISTETGLPIFVSDGRTANASSLIQSGLIPLPDMPNEAAVNVRDMLQESCG